MPTLLRAEDSAPASNVTVMPPILCPEKNAGAVTPLMSSGSTLAPSDRSGRCASKVIVVPSAPRETRKSPSASGGSVMRPSGVPSPSTSIMRVPSISTTTFARVNERSVMRMASSAPKPGIVSPSNVSSVPSIRLRPGRSFRLSASLAVATRLAGPSPATTSSTRSAIPPVAIPSEVWATETVSAP